MSSIQIPVETLTVEELAAVSDRMRAARAVPKGPLQCTLIAGGRSNLTWRLSDGVESWVLRMPPRVGRTPSAHDVAREFRVTRALAGTPVPVAPAVLLEEDEAVLGGPFAALHRVDVGAVGLSGFGRPDGYAARQLRRWSGQWEIVGQPWDGALAEELIARLQASLPEQRTSSVVHGDFRIDNTLLRLDPARAPEVAAVVDWELSTIGDPVADVAMMCAYRHPAFDLIVGQPSAWTSEALPSVDALAGQYEAAGRMPLIDWDFHLALAYFKIAVIAAGIDHRVRAGAASGPGFDTAGQSVVSYLELGLSKLTAAS